MTTPASVRLPVEPLMRATGSDRSVAECRGFVAPNRPNTQTHLAMVIGRSRRLVARWIADGGIPFHSADAIAVAIGLHPCQVWGELWWEACTEQGARMSLNHVGERVA